MFGLYIYQFLCNSPISLKCSNPFKYLPENSCDVKNIFLYKRKEKKIIEILMRRIKYLNEKKYILTNNIHKRPISKFCLVFTNNYKIKFISLKMIQNEV